MIHSYGWFVCTVISHCIYYTFFVIITDGLSSFEDITHWITSFKQTLTITFVINIGFRFIDSSSSKTMRSSTHHTLSSIRNVCASSSSTSSTHLHLHIDDTEMIKYIMNFISKCMLMNTCMCERQDARWQWRWCEMFTNDVFSTLNDGESLRRSEQWKNDCVDVNHEESWVGHKVICLEDRRKVHFFTLTWKTLDHWKESIIIVSLYIHIFTHFTEWVH
jgi:hypothetical protein